ncbi:MAG: ABC transporter permease [Simkaniaceae bacterium]|nr:ABC transporter permease [Simkaniaceae bacterium]
MSLETSSVAKPNYFIQIYGLMSREIMRFMSVPYQTLAAPIISSLLYILIFGISLGNAIKDQDGASYLTFLIPGLITMTLLRNAFDNASSSVVAGKYVNELQDLRVAPFSTSQILWAISGACFIRGLIVATFTFLVGEAFMYFQMKTLLTFYSFTHAILFILIGGLSFSKLGLAVAIRSTSFEHIGMINSFVLTPLVYLGGVFFSLDNLQPFWQNISKINPILYNINGIRYAMTGVSDVPLVQAYAVTIGFGIICHFLARSGLNQGKNYVR